VENHPDSIQGKVCLITGASRTLGAIIARHMASSGYHIIANYLHAEKEAHALCRDLSEGDVSAVAIQADVTQPAETNRLVTEALRHFETIDVLVNNVGPYVDTPFLELSVTDFDRILVGNIRSTFLMSQAVGRHMKKQGHGHIINIAATDAFNRSHSVYGLAKAAVIHLTESLALELAPDVRVNALAPDLIADNEDMPSEEFVKEAIGGTPMGRLITRREIAQMVNLINTPAFDTMTGQTLVMDGGRSIPRISMG